MATLKSFNLIDKFDAAERLNIACAINSYQQIVPAGPLADPDSLDYFDVDYVLTACAETIIRFGGADETDALRKLRGIYSKLDRNVSALRQWGQKI